MELSSKSESALLALLELADSYQEHEPLQIRQIAAQQNIPDRYLEQLLATLRRGGLVRSQRGAKGGYYLAREPWQVTLLDVLTCLEGADAQSTDPIDGDSTASSAVIREIWQEVDAAARDVLQRYTIQDVQERRNARKQLDFMYYI